MNHEVTDLAKESLLWGFKKKPHSIGRVACGAGEVDWEATYASVISDKQACIQIMPMIFFFFVDLSWG